MSTSSALSALRRFINASTETPSEIRLYVRENVMELATAFGVTPETILGRIDGVSDDTALAPLLLKNIRNAEATKRAVKRDARATAAQAAADALAATVTWDGDRASLDIQAVLSQSLTKRSDLLVFACGDFTVAIPQALLLDLARLRRRDLSGFVDAQGLHIRWKTGGLNLRSQVDPSADRIVLSLSRNLVASAA
jgi:hypothetical protein